MSPLERAFIHAVVALAPAPVRESLHGDLLEAESDVVRECLRSAGPLARERLRRAGPTRVGLAFAAGLLCAALVHAASDAAWRAVLTSVPLRAWHQASHSWRLVSTALEIVVALLGFGAVVASGLARKGTPR